MKFVALIPARLGSSRLPNKMMALLADKPVIVHTALAVKASRLFDEVIVVCDSTVIADVAEAAGIKAMISKKEHASGTDRIAEAAAGIDADVFINVQGDEPFMQLELLQKIITVFEQDATNEVDIASPMRVITDEADIHNPNVVKVVVDRNMNALYFSRSPIPYLRDADVTTTYYRHVGVYAFRKQTLLRFASLDETPLEKAEKLENLRMLEHGMRVRMVITDYSGIGIDTKEDLEKARNIIQ
ncbi:MAG TPA: 3-deoxy-manno-octulosonate cytidylyltransferase [Lacibacter sp.]|nr:3-deoxy-manno-octulosonate cytidylyltransferase [Lacibacter sp.]